MNHRGMTWLIAGMVLWAAPAGPAGIGTFTVPEDRVKVVLHVDGQSAKAADANPGTEAAPFKTIGRAAAVARWSGPIRIRKRSSRPSG